MALWPVCPDHHVPLRWTNGGELASCNLPHQPRLPGPPDLVQVPEVHHPLRRSRTAPADPGVPRPDHRKQRPEALKVKDPLPKKRRQPRVECRAGDC